MAARSSGWRFLRVVTGGILLVLLVWLASVVSVVIAGWRDHAQPADAIVVLGAAQYVGRPSPVLKARLDHAIALWKAGDAPVLVLTGGTGAGDTTSEAAVGRHYALANGVPDEALLLESRGRTTSESMRAVSAIMSARGIKRAILVSDPFHMLRLTILARRLGLEPFTSPTQTSPIASSRMRTLRYTVGESIKVPWAFLFERK